MESYDIIRGSNCFEIIKNQHRKDGSIREEATIGFRQRLEDAIEVVRDLFSVNADNEILVFNKDGALLTEIKIIEVTDNGRGIVASNAGQVDGRA